jgi:spermidine dehydrogenase
LYGLGLPDSVTQADTEEDPAACRFPIFPDGNASVARLLVRKLIPEVAPANSMQDTRGLIIHSWTVKALLCACV